jgi:hypothetical protein
VDADDGGQTSLDAGFDSRTGVQFDVLHGPWTAKVQLSGGMMLMNTVPGANSYGVAATVIGAGTRHPSDRIL